MCLLVRIFKLWVFQINTGSSLPLAVKGQAVQYVAFHSFLSNSAIQRALLIL